MKRLIFIIIILSFSSFVYADGFHTYDDDAKATVDAITTTGGDEGDVLSQNANGDFVPTAPGAVSVTTENVGDAVIAGDTATTATDDSFFAVIISGVMEKISLTNLYSEFADGLVSIFEPAKGEDDNYVTDTEKADLHASGSDDQVGDGVTVTGAGTVGDPFVAVAGTGDVVGPSSAVDENVAVYDGVTGKLIKDGGAKVSDFLTAEVDGSVSNEINTITADTGGSTSGLALSVLGGGTITTSRSGDLIIVSSGSETDPIVGAITGIVKADGASAISAAIEDTDYQGVLAEGAFADGDKTKVDHITVTQAVDLDTMESDIALKVSGPSSATDNAIARYNLTTGKLIQDSGVTISDGDDMAGVDEFQFGTASHNGDSIGIGQIRWNAEEETLEVGLTADVTGQMFEEALQVVRNNTTVAIDNGKAVMFAGTVGASSQLLIAPMIADGTYLPGYFAGIVTEDIDAAVGSTGFITWRGKVRGLDTDGSPYGESWSDGDLLYVSDSTAGDLTNIVPVSPNQRISIGVVILAGNNGSIFVRPSWHGTIDHADNVDTSGLSDGDILIYNSSSTLWEDGQETDPNALLTAGTNNVKDTHIDWGAGASQVSAGDIPIADVGDIIIATEVEGVLQENRTAIDLNTAKETNTDDQTASEVDIAVIGTPTYTTVQDFIDTTTTAGKTSGGGFTDEADGDITVAAGTGRVKTTDDVLGETKNIDWVEVNNLTLVDNTTNYMYYDFGSATVKTTTTKSDVSWTDQFLLGKAYREGTKLHFVESGMVLDDFQGRVLRRFVNVDGEQIRATGLQISEIGDLGVHMTGGVIYSGLTPHIMSVVDTSGVDTMELYYNDGSWQHSSVSVLGSTQYNNYGVGLVNLSPNQYAVYWVYMHHEGDLYIIYGLGSYTYAEAQDADAPANLPSIVEGFSSLIAKIVIERNATTEFADVDTPWEETISSSTVTQHNGLSGLDVDDYQHITEAEETILENTSGTNTGDKTFGIADDNGVEIDQADAASGEYTRLTANGLESRSKAETQGDLDLEAGTDFYSISAADSAVDGNVTRVVTVSLIGGTTDTAIVDGVGDFVLRIPSTLNGWDLTGVAAYVQTAGTTNTTDIQIYNLTQTADMLSTVMTIDSTETDTATAATPAVIDSVGDNDDVATADKLRFDVDAVSTTEAKGLTVELTFEKP